MGLSSTAGPKVESGSVIGAGFNVANVELWRGEELKIKSGNDSLEMILFHIVITIFHFHLYSFLTIPHSPH